jgi:hypothetical protein
MVDHLMDTSGTDEGEVFATPERVPLEQSSPDLVLSNLQCREMSLSMLAEHCVRELNNYRQGEPYIDTYGVELLRRAIVQGEQEARMWVQHCFMEVVLNWLHLHPKTFAACRIESEENYVAQAFERFWLATTSKQRMEFSTLASALQYLRASLLGAILDSLRVYSRPGEISMPEPGESGEPNREDESSSSEIWDILKRLLPNPREQRLAFLFFHCGLEPREIVHFCPQEFNDVREVYRLRCTITERLSPAMVAKLTGFREEEDWSEQ